MTNPHVTNVRTQLRETEGWPAEERCRWMKAAVRSIPKGEALREVMNTPELLAFSVQYSRVLAMQAFTK